MLMGASTSVIKWVCTKVSAPENLHGMAKMEMKEQLT